MPQGGRAIPLIVYSATIALVFGGLGASAADPPENPRSNQPIQILPAGQPQLVDSPRPLQYLPETLARQVIRFDFEEARLAPIEMPRFFYRYGATGDEGDPGSSAWAEGFPPFGSIGLSNEHASEGRWSFGFELGGGSLASRVPTHVIPVMPGATYETNVQIRTSGLHHARARLVCWMHDDQGNAIESTRAAGQAIRTGGAWQRQAVRVSNAPPEAVGLVVELQLVQPRHYATADLEDDAPMLEDVTGHAWFDDLTVSLLPNVDFAVGDGTGIVQLPQQPSVRVSLRDAARAPLTAHLVVRDLYEHVIVQEAFPIDQGDGAITIPLPTDRPGWYRADLQLKTPGDGEVIDQLARAFVVTADEGGIERAAASPFVAISRFDGSSAASDIDSLLRVMRPREVTHRVDAFDLAAEVNTALFEPLIEHVDHVAGLVASSSIWLTQAQSGGGETDARAISDVLTHHGIHVRRWIRETIDASTGASLRRMAAAPDILDVVTIDQDPLAAQPDRKVLLRVPSEWPASQIERGLISWFEHHDVDGVIIEEPHTADFPDRQHAALVLDRALRAWRAGAPEILVDGPWIRRGDRVLPTALLPAWSMLSRHLRGREFLADLSPNEFTHGWLIGSPTGSDAALIVWSDAVHGDDPDMLLLSIGDDAHVNVDHTGHAAPVRRDADRSSIAITDLPSVVEGVDRHLLQFIAGAAFVPDQLVPIPSLQEAWVRIANPWPRPITGSLRFDTANGLEILPRELSFELESGEVADLPITVLPTHRVQTGRHSLSVHCELLADRRIVFPMDIPLTIGLDGVSFTSGWQFRRTPAGGTAVEVVTSVSNTSAENRRLALTVLTPDGGLTRRALPALLAGESTSVHLALPIEVSGLAGGGKIRIGLADLSTGAQLNHVLSITPPPAGASGLVDAGANLSVANPR